MLSTATLIMWAFLADGSSTRTTEEMDSLQDCMKAQYHYLTNPSPLEGPDVTLAAGCIVHNQRLS